MLTFFLVKNFALIEESEVSWKKGFSVITGETGAGKSILLSALKLILGERADSKTLKKTDKKCIIEAHFDISELDIKTIFDKYEVDYEETTILRREILPNGKSRAFINDTPFPISTLKIISSHLIDIHSQFETSQIIDTDFQFNLIDENSNNQELIKEYKILFSKFQKKNIELKTYKEELSNYIKEADYNSFLISEIEEVNIENINLIELENTIKNAENAENILETLSFSNQTLESEDVGILGFINQIIQKLDRLKNESTEINELKNRFESLNIELQDIHSELENISSLFEFEPADILEKQIEFNKINTLLQKHQVLTIDELKTIKQNLSDKQLNFENLDKKINEVEKEIKNLEAELEKKSTLISLSRKKSIPILIDKSKTILSRLGMDKSSISIKQTPSEKFNSFGKESLEFLFSANTGMPLQPIQKAISGGEKSRLMLTFKSIQAENKKLPTLIFDEIDTGVSGKIAHEMSKIMLELAKNIQVFAITHLPQTASKAKQHYKVVKFEEKKQTKSSIKLLNNQERVQEIANLLSGDSITEAAINQAKELIKN